VPMERIDVILDATQERPLLASVAGNRLELRISRSDYERSSCFAEAWQAQLIPVERQFAGDDFQTLLKPCGKFFQSWSGGIHVGVGLVNGPDITIVQITIPLEKVEVWIDSRKSMPTIELLGHPLQDPFSVIVQGDYTGLIRLHPDDWKASTCLPKPMQSNR
jgi:hypothetical protein